MLAGAVTKLLYSHSQSLPLASVIVLCDVLYCAASGREAYFTFISDKDFSFSFDVPVKSDVTYENILLNESVQSLFRKC